MKNNGGSIFRHELILSPTLSRKPKNQRPASAKGWGTRLHPILPARVRQPSGPVTGQMMALVEAAQRQKTGFAGDLAAAKISANGLIAVQGEVQL